MKKNYVYAIALALLSVTVWLSYYFYLEHRPANYRYGTFVELPETVTGEIWELSA